MNEANPRHPRLSESHEADLDEYHAVSGLAVGGLVVGLLSCVALVDPMGWLVPPVGILLCLLALWRIACNAPELIGRKAAVVGLVLSILFGGAGISHQLTYNWLLRRQARQFGTAWFDLLARQQPQMAHQMTLPPDERRPLDSDLWAMYRDAPSKRKSLKEFADDSSVRTLLALGEKAKVRYCKTVDMYGPPGAESLDQFYSVTYDEAGSKKTFFIVLILRRPPIKHKGYVNWTVNEFHGGVTPPWMEEAEAAGAE